MTSNATWLTISGMTGLTFPGMIDDPAWAGGRLISDRPTDGPDDVRRRSLHTFESFTATRFRTPETWTNAPQSWVASIGSPAGTTSRPVMSRRCAQASRA